VAKVVLLAVELLDVNIPVVKRDLSVAKIKTQKE
jgi:hypothetical protein